MYKDEEIEFRVFDYGYRYALRERSGGDVLVFLDLRVIQLYRHNGMPDTKTLLLDFGAQGSFEYKIPVFKLLEHSIEEISRRRMIILMPFMILKLRRSFSYKYSVLASQFVICIAFSRIAVKSRFRFFSVESRMPIFNIFSKSL